MGASKRAFMDMRTDIDNGYDGIDDNYFYSQQNN
jgi:hypothetical protein